MLLRLVFVGLLAAGVALPALTFHPIEAAAAKKKGGLKNRSSYTPAQREKILADARKLCKKKYGAPATVYRIDYATNTVWCNPN